MAIKKLARIVLGIILILWGLEGPILGLLGNTGAATVTGVRKQISRKTSYETNRYLYDISYSFKLPSGKTIDSFTYRKGTFTNSNSPGKNGAFDVKYLGFFPYINIPAEDVVPDIVRIIVLAAGVLLIVPVKLLRRKQR